MTKQDNIIENNRGFFPAVRGKKRKLAEEITSPEFDGNISALCKKMKISRQTYYRWLVEADFKDYCEWLISRYTDSELANMWRNVIKAGNKGDVTAMKLYFELTGRFKQQIDISGGVTIIDDIKD